MPVVTIAQEGREQSGRFSWWLPENISIHGIEIDLIFNAVLYLMCIGVFIALGIVGDTGNARILQEALPGFVDEHAVIGNYNCKETTVRANIVEPAEH